MLAFTVCKKRLGSLWFLAAAGLGMLLVAQTRTGNVFAGLESDVFGWFLPTVMPTLGLMAAVFVTDAQAPRDPARLPVDRFFFWLTFLASAAYLLLVALPLLSPDPAEQRLAWMKSLSPLLAALQGLVSTLIAVFFFKPTAARDAMPPGATAADDRRTRRGRPALPRRK